MPDKMLAQNDKLIPDRLVQFVWREDRSTVEWYTFYVVAPKWKHVGRGQKAPSLDRKYNGGWNGERIARGTDMRLLRERYPQVYKWMLGVLKDVAA